MFEVNEYFAGRVKSITFQSPTLPATIGVMAAGEYEFGTAAAETMTITSGALQVKLPGADWRRVEAGQSFEVPADSRFQVAADADVAYLCLYHR